jgi:hypothetical protein
MKKNVGIIDLPNVSLYGKCEKSVPCIQHVIECISLVSDQ